MRKIILLIFIVIFVITYREALPLSRGLPDDFTDMVSDRYKIPSEFLISTGGDTDRMKNIRLNHYPVIMIPGNKRSYDDWLGENTGNAKEGSNVYNAFIDAGFLPSELWLYQYTMEGKEMRNIEELTDGLKQFIYAVLFYTKSSRVQILAHGEGAVLAQATIKKYNLYNLIHALAYIAGPFHGSPGYTYLKALGGSPVSSNLTPGSDFLQELNLPDETPYNISEGKNKGNASIKYMTIYNGIAFGDKYFPENHDSPSLMGADNHELNQLNHDGLRSSRRSTCLFIPFLSDKAIAYNPLYDKDLDGFMDYRFEGADCNDNEASVFPGAEEITEDGIDQDCNGMDISSCGGKDRLILPNK